MKLSEQLRDASAKATGGEWEADAIGYVRKGYLNVLPNAANARLITLMCSESNCNHIIAALEAYERGPTPEQVRGACARVCADRPIRIKGLLPGMADGAVSAANQIEAAIRALDLSKIGGE